MDVDKIVGQVRSIYCDIQQYIRKNGGVKMNFNRCMGCMKEYEGKGACPYCGFDITKYEPAFHHLPPGTILNGKYVLGKVLGEGGFGISYIGWDLNLDHKVAIKEYYPTSYVTRQAMYTPEVTMLTGNHQEFYKKGLDKFVEEARTLAKFSGLQGIVQVRDYFQENGTAYIVMEFAEGRTLKKILEKSDGKLPADRVFEMMRPVIESLEEVHKKGLIHRDISPDNMIVDEDGGVKLLDFGAARNYISEEEKSLSIILKPGYTPEEQYRSRGEQGPWTDVYALCATMYRTITGERPTESLDRLNNDDLKRPSSCGIAIGEQQEAALMKGLAVYKKDRLANMEELRNALFRDDIKIMSSPGTISNPKPPVKKGIVVGLCAAVIVTVICIVGLKGGKSESEQVGDKQENTETEIEADETLTVEDFKSVTKAHWETWTDEKGNEYQGFKNKNGKANGEVKITFISGNQYEGYCENGVLKGHGKFIWSDSSQYDGGWEAGQMSGFGIMHWQESGETYKGEWSNGQKNGLGISYKEDGTYTVSVWKDNEKVENLEAVSLEASKTKIYIPSVDELSEQAVIVYENDIVYIGEISDQKMNGRGTCIYSDQYWEGQFENGECQGVVASYYEDGTRIIAYYSNGKRNGPSIQIDPNGRRLDAFYREGQAIRRWLNVSGKDGSVTTGIPTEDGTLITDTEAETWIEGDKMYIGKRKNGKIEGDYVDLHTDGRHCLRNSEDGFYVQFCNFYDRRTNAYFGWDPSEFIEDWKQGELVYAYQQENDRIGLGIYDNGKWIPLEQ